MKTLGYVICCSGLFFILLVTGAVYERSNSTSYIVYGRIPTEQKINDLETRIERLEYIYEIIPD